MSLCNDCNNVYKLFTDYYNLKKIWNNKLEQKIENYKIIKNVPFHNTCYILLKNMMEKFHKESMIYLQLLANKHNIDVNILINFYYDDI